MPDETLLQELTTFLASRTATRICRRYGAESLDALGDLYIRLSGLARRPIRKPKAWVRKSATGLLRNFMRAEYRQLGQTLEARS
jgi:DNA-directed RNA polymerase specialized sigma24 family protein